MIGSKKILIIENEIATRKILADKLTREKFLVIQSGTGEEGLSLALKEHPDLILLDIFMPKMNGLEVINALHQDKLGKTVPVIILSNLNDDHQMLESIKHANYDYLIKTNHNLSSIVAKIKAKLGS
ncbi:MAG: response regulator [Candidatus Magasanikbacteria bacterium]|nr:response regulator [Candidatus Magasanikbacteria bacterium]